MVEITDDIAILLDGMLGLMQQYMPNDETTFDYQFMTAGEDAAMIIEKYELGKDIGYSIVIDKQKCDELQERVRLLDWQ